MKEISMGCIIYNKKLKKYLILQYDAGHWDFVKGKKEKRETDEFTLRREAEEETGIADLEIMEGFKAKTDYEFSRDGNIVKKEVTFYFAFTNTDEVKLSYEHTDFEWLSKRQALLKLTYKAAKQVLEKANTFLEEQYGKKKKKLFHF